jgi:nitrogen fixation protein NifU and related proteins
MQAVPAGTFVEAMADLRELYQQIILEHNKSPRNFKKLEAPAREVEAYNPLCGDHYWLYAAVDDGQIADVGFQGAGCAISKSSASVMSQAVKGKSVEEFEELFNGFRAMVTGDAEADVEKLGKLAAFEGVKEHPSRVKCAILAWHALNSALHGEAEPVKTE